VQLWTCNYAPAGNFNNAYSTQVLDKVGTRASRSDCDACAGMDCSGGGVW